MTIQQPQPQFKLELGTCFFTGEKIIEIKYNKKGEVTKADRLKNYRSSYIQLSNGTKMRVAYDESVKMTKKKEKWILEEHKIFWEKGLKESEEARIKRAIQWEKNKTKQGIEEYNNITVI